MSEKKIQFIDSASAKKSIAKLEKFYKKESIAPEKKPYLLRMDQSTGPYLAVQGGKNILDASSQIASVGTGFNASCLWGTILHQEAWLNQKGTGHQQAIRKAFEELLQKKLNWPKLHTTFCNSGAEANEIALGECFRRRVDKQRRKVLAFEGSFHGRMMVALSATWNPVKRQQFEWAGYEAEFVSHPTVPCENFLSYPLSTSWIKLWENASLKSFNTACEKFYKKADAIMKDEINVLRHIRKKLHSNEIFAVTIEPMQCEGGYNYSSSRFHHALLHLCRSFSVPLVYDEVQTGFGFSGEFFWHRQFNLKDSGGNEVYPNYIVCAKKSQTGLVLAHDTFHRVEQYCTASMIRGYYQASMLDQQREAIIRLEKKLEKLLKPFIKTFNKVIHTPKVKGMSFSFEFYDAKLLMDFIKARFEVGLLFYPAGSHTARFCLNLACKDTDIEELFKRLGLILKKCWKGIEINASDLDHSISKHDHKDQLPYYLQMLQAKQGKLKKQTDQSMLNQIKRELPEQIQKKAKLSLLSKKNFSHFKQHIISLQKRVYEKTRQTPIQVFEEMLNVKNHLGIMLEVDGKLVAMNAAAPLKHFSHERGVLRDPHFDDEQCLYGVDTTVDVYYRGKQLGKWLKVAQLLIAQNRGIERLHSRNRDGHAAVMINLNHSFGSYTREWIEGDYPDQEGRNDCLYQSLSLKWEQAPLKLSKGIDVHLESNNLSQSFIKKHLYSIVNKICLSNFVPESYLEDLDTFVSQLPKDLQHVYGGSGMSEAVDKVTKVLWLNAKPKQKMLSFEGCFFGEGSFMSRSLSSGNDAFFEVEHLPFPTEDNYKSVLKQCKFILSQGETLGVWAEPLAQKSMASMPLAFLKELKTLCQRNKTPLVYHDTASLFHRYSSKGFSAACVKEISPDIAFSYLGGQMSVVYMKKKYWDSTPLMFISTWDGDEYSMASFVEAVKLMKSDKGVIQAFTKKLKDVLKQYSVKKISIQNGAGWFEGDIPDSLAKCFKRVSRSKRFLVCPSIQAMKRFIKEVK